jgi:hypothetical protein
MRKKGIKDDASDVTEDKSEDTTETPAEEEEAEDKRRWRGTTAGKREWGDEDEEWRWTRNRRQDPPRKPTNTRRNRAKQTTTSVSALIRSTCTTHGAG